MALIAVLFCLGFYPAKAAAQVTNSFERVSIGSDGAEANDLSEYPTITSDGRFVVFTSYASNLVPDDANGMSDVFLHDRQTGETTRISISSSGAQADEPSGLAAISADGSTIAYVSLADNLVAGDTNRASDIFVYNRLTGQTERVSVGSNGEEANGGSWYPTISDDGRYVAFNSLASNLVSGDSNGVLDAFVHDRQTGQTIRVSVDSNGEQGSLESRDPIISGDGSTVAFTSAAGNLAGNDTNNVEDAFVHDLQTGQTDLISEATDGTEGNAPSLAMSISDNGRFVVFDSYSSNLVEKMSTIL